jgi:hypothetical protein
MKVRRLTSASTGATYSIAVWFMNNSSALYVQKYADLALMRIGLNTVRPV